jgi:hypothetical protein
MEHKEPPPLVSVLWEDAACLDHEPWVPTPETPPTYSPVLVTTVGFLLHQSDAGLIITGAWSPDRTGPRDQIPAGMLRSVVFLVPAPGPAKAKRGKR